MVPVFEISCSSTDRTTLSFYKTSCAGGVFGTLTTTTPEFILFIFRYWRMSVLGSACLRNPLLLKELQYSECPVHIFA